VHTSKFKIEINNNFPIKDAKIPRIKAIIGANSI
jgi:hypothetical protein